MVVEFLTFRVPVEAREEWLEVEARHWTSFLQARPGFLRKEVWVDVDDPESVTAAIWWRSIEEWHSIPQADLDEVIAQMGPFERTASLRTFDVVSRTD